MLQPLDSELSQRYTLLHSSSAATNERERSEYNTTLPCLALLAGLTTALVVAPAPLQAQTAAPAPAQSESYAPESGQPGKDVVWVPTPDTLVERMLDMAKATPQDFLIDLGSGDGRTVIAAAQRGLKAHGIEYNPEMVALSQRRAQAAGVADRATFAKADIFESDFSKAQVITLFLLPELNERLRPQILELEPGTRIVSNSFRMGDWEPDRTDRVEGCNQWCTAHLWLVPAKVEGSWRLGEQELKLAQKYQMLSGTLGTTPIENGRLDGKQISFTAGGVAYTGTVTGTAMSGSATGGSMANWTATKS